MAPTCSITSMHCTQYLLDGLMQLALVQTCHTALKEQEAQAFFGNHDSLLTKLKTGDIYSIMRMPQITQVHILYMYTQVHVSLWR